jgi:cell division septal protein FtsQ
VKRLQNNAVVQRVRIHRRLPNGIDIRIEEREPVAMLSAGEVFLVDKEGVLLPLVARRYMNVPVLSGLRDTTDARGMRRLTEESTKRMDRFLKAAHAARSQIAGRISQAQFGGDGIVRIRLEASRTVVEMDERNVERRIEQLWRLAQVRKQSGRQQPRRISLCYANCAYVRQ